MTRILIVEDERILREQLVRMLQSRGYEVESSDDGLTALALLKEKKVDLIIVDFVMTRMNGYHFVRMLETKKIAADTPVILMSSLIAKIKERFATSSLVREFLEKPFTKEQLLDAVERQLQQSQSVDIEVDVMPAVDPSEEVTPARAAVDEPWAIVVAMREVLQDAVSRQIGEHYFALVNASDEGVLRDEVSRLLDNVFDDSTMARLTEIVHHFRRGEPRT